MALLDKLDLVHPGLIVYHLRNGVELLLRARSYDAVICKEIWIDKVYTSTPGFSILDDWVIADVGGHIGIFSVFATTRAKGVKVYTFEPSPENFAILSRNIERNKLSNVKVFNVAVGGRDGNSILHLYPDGGQHTFLQRSDPTLCSVREIKVETWSIARMLQTIAAPVDLLKMDIEGMEYEALLSCRWEDLQRIERIALEYHDIWVHTPHRVSELVDFLGEMGFSTYLPPDREILVAERQRGISIFGLEHARVHPYPSSQTGQESA